MSPIGNSYKGNSSVVPWIVNALSNELLYRDEPTWPGLNSQEDAITKRLKALRFSIKYTFVEPSLRVIAADLEHCSPNNRCCSACCSECGRALQRFFVAECKSLFLGQSSCVASVIDSKMSISEDLSQICATSLINRVKSVLKKNGVKLAAGGIDLSYNEDKIGIFAPHWCVHLWLILPDANRHIWEPALRLANPASPAVPRPIKIMKWDGRDEAFAYALKTSFKRRVTVRKKRRSGKHQRNTSEQELRVTERIRLYQYLDFIGLHTRVFLMGLRPTLTNKGFFFVKLGG